MHGLGHKQVLTHDSLYAALIGLPDNTAEELAKPKSPCETSFGTVVPDNMRGLQRISTVL